MDIALANDEYYFPGLWCAVLSLLASTTDASCLNIYVIDTGISDTSWSRLSEAVAKHPSPPRLIRKKFPRHKLDGLNIPGDLSPLVYARLFLPELVECQRILYLDSDLLIFKDILELENIDLTGYACAAVINEDGETLGFDLSNEECEELNLDPQSSYYNAGLLYMNLEYWREHNLTSVCLKLLQSRSFRFADQSAINSVMNGKMVPLDREWNRFANLLVSKEIVCPGSVIHYTNDKPWLLQMNNPETWLWMKFLKDSNLTIPKPKIMTELWERYLFLNFIRMGGYAVLAMWYALRKNPKLAKGYSSSFFYWLKFIACRQDRLDDFELAFREIQSTQYGPDWLLE